MSDHTIKSFFDKAKMKLVDVEPKVLSHGISHSTFFRDLKADITSVSAARLIIYASLLSVKIDDLLKTPKTKSGRVGEGRKKQILLKKKV